MYESLIIEQIQSKRIDEICCEYTKHHMYRIEVRNCLRKRDRINIQTVPRPSTIINRRDQRIHPREEENSSQSDNTNLDIRKVISLGLTNPIDAVCIVANRYDFFLLLTTTVANYVALVGLEEFGC